MEAAQKTLVGCLEAIEAFKLITKIDQICLATPDDCERFQHEALVLPAAWRRRKLVDSSIVIPKQVSEDDACESKTLSPSTIVKWSTALRAAFERANRNAGKKCVRGVVPEHKLLEQNPWSQFTWIDGKDRTIRHFDAKELVSLIDWLETRWEGLTIATLYVKVSLWSWARRSEVSSLKWSDERSLLSESHFKSTGKKNVTKWFRIPNALRQELEGIRCESDFVFGDYPRQLIEYYRKRNEVKSLHRVREDFAPVNLGEWMYKRIVEWSEGSPKGQAYLHHFRKTGLQLALSGEHAMSDVAKDASITPGVMEASYAQEFDEELWRKSNRTYRRIRASLPHDVAVRYGYDESERERLLEELDRARMKANWEEVARLAQLIEQLDQEVG